MHVSHIPCTTLRKKPRNFQRRFEVNDKQASSTIITRHVWWRDLYDDTETYAASTISREEGLILIYEMLQSTQGVSNCQVVLTFPTASPTKPFISICKLRLKFPPSSGELGSANRGDSTTWGSIVGPRERSMDLGKDEREGRLEFRSLAEGANTVLYHSCPAIEGSSTRELVEI